jgi:hypothetical protein
MLDDAAGNFAPAPGEAPAGPGAHGARSATPDAHGSSSLGQQEYAQQVKRALAKAAVQQLRPGSISGFWSAAPWGCLGLIRLQNHEYAAWAHLYDKTSQ